MGKMFCILCEKELEPVFKDSISQAYDAGSIEINFPFGSKYDHIGFRDPIRAMNKVDGVEIAIGPDDKEKIFLGDIVGTKPVDLTKWNLPNGITRDLQLASCSHIVGNICDDCFKKKAHLFRGYEKTNDDWDLVVE